MDNKEFNDYNMEKSEDPLFLPEWLFVINKTKVNGLKKNRTILLHTPSCSILEIFAGEKKKSKSQSYEFLYTDIKGFRKKFKILIYFTLCDDLYLLFRKATLWYSNYLDWKKSKQLKEEKLRQN